VHRQGNAQFGTIGVFEDVMAAARVVNKKPCSLKGPATLVWACKQGDGPR